MGNIFIGLDDTDNHESRGTGYLARMIAEKLSEKYKIHGVTRHQLLFDPRVPYTAKNSCAAIILNSAGEDDLDALFSEVREIMLSDFQVGSDPGLCVCDQVPDSVQAFGQSAQKELVNQTQARDLAKTHQIRLEGLGGTNDGGIGALAAVGLAAFGNDGRYVQIGRTRDYNQLVPVNELLSAGINMVIDLEGNTVGEGDVLAQKLRPSRREGKVILYVHRCDDYWAPDKLD